jgi:hypothetical protein
MSGLSVPSLESATGPKAEFYSQIKKAIGNGQLVDISLAFATTAFTNVFNRINDTDVDFARRSRPKLKQGPRS